MANVSFHVGSTTPASSGLTVGGLYVDSTNGQLFYAKTATSKKQIGSSLKMMSDKKWIQLNGSSGKVIGDLTDNEKEIIANYASELYISYYNIPFGALCPNLNDNSGANVTVSYYAFLHRAPTGTNYFTTNQERTIVYSSVNPQHNGGNVSWVSCSINLDKWEESHTYMYFNADGNFIGNTRSNECNSYFRIVAYRF